MKINIAMLAHLMKYNLIFLTCMIPGIVFGQTMTVHTKTTSQPFRLSEIDSITFENDTGSGSFDSSFKVFNLAEQTAQPSLDPRFLNSMAIIYGSGIENSATPNLPTEASLKNAVTSRSEYEYIVFDMYEGVINKHSTTAQALEEGNKVAQILTWAREVAPKGQKFGFYGFHPLPEIWGWTNPEELARIKELDDTFLSTHTPDFLAPSMYAMGGWDLNDPSGAQATLNYMNKQMEETERLSVKTGKPAYVFITDAYGVGGALEYQRLTPDQYRTYQLDVVYDQQDMDGVIMWTGEYMETWAQSLANGKLYWYSVLLDFMNDNGL